jgi:SiaC family regulatory phosphoprotein
MELLKQTIESTKGTPEITLNPEGTIKIEGRSINELGTESSMKLEEWLNKYLCDPPDLTCIDLFLEYLNTSNFRFYISLLKRIETILLKNKKYIINWYYEEGDEDIIEKGEYISSFLELPFNFIMIPNQID